MTPDTTHSGRQYWRMHASSVSEIYKLIWSFVFFAQATINRQQLWCASATIVRTWVRIRFVIVSLDCSKKANRCSCHAIHRCPEHLYRSIWKWTCRVRCRFAKLSFTLIRRYPSNDAQCSEINRQAHRLRTMANATSSTIGSHCNSVKHYNFAEPAVVHWSMTVIRLCKVSSVGSCGDVIVATYHHSTGWELYAMRRIGTHGNGLVAKRWHCHSGICPVAMRTVHDLMDPRDGCGATPIVTHNWTSSVSTVSEWLVQYFSSWKCIFFWFAKIEPKACGRPEQPPNSTMIAPKGFDVGATVDYGCDDGHLLVGPSTRSCLDTGFYNEFPPVCKCKLSLLHATRFDRSIPIIFHLHCEIMNLCRHWMWAAGINSKWWIRID